MTLIFQLLFLAVSIFAGWSAWQDNKKGDLGGKAVVFWIFFWFFASVVVFWPSASSWVAAYLGIGRGTDLVVYCAFALVFFLLFKMNVKLDSLNRGLTKMVRERALKKSENKREDL